MRFIIAITLTLAATQFALAFSLKPGDLLFQDLNCGKLCNAIFSVTSGYGNTDVSHVGMLVSSGEVIEAIGKNVHLTPIKQFLNRGPVMVGRLTQPYRHLIPQAINLAKSWIDEPYNYNFTPQNHDKKFYCSQLVYDAFKQANHNVAIFAQDHMNFKNPQTHKFYPAWSKYFNQIHSQIPQGHPGTNPGKMSLSPNIKIIHFYEKLSQDHEA